MQLYSPPRSTWKSFCSRPNLLFFYADLIYRTRCPEGPFSMLAQAGLFKDSTGPLFWQATFASVSPASCTSALALELKAGPMLPDTGNHQRTSTKNFYSIPGLIFSRDLWDTSSEPCFFSSEFHSAHHWGGDKMRLSPCLGHSWSSFLLFTRGDGHFSGAVFTTEKDFGLSRRMVV